MPAIVGDNDADGDAYPANVPCPFALTDKDGIIAFGDPPAVIWPTLLTLDEEDSEPDPSFTIKPLEVTDADGETVATPKNILSQLAVTLELQGISADPPAVMIEPGLDNEDVALIVDPPPNLTLSAEDTVVDDVSTIDVTNCILTP